MEEHAKTLNDAIYAGRIMIAGFSFLVVFALIGVVSTGAFLVHLIWH